MTQCDYCNEKASNAIYTCPVHVKVLDQVASRRKDHLMRYILAQSKRNKTVVQKLQARIKELTEKQKEEPEKKKAEK